MSYLWSLLAQLAFTGIFICIILSLHFFTQRKYALVPVFGAVGITMIFIHFVKRFLLSHFFEVQVQSGVQYDNTLIIGVIATFWLVYLINGSSQVRRMISLLILMELMIIGFILMTTFFLAGDEVFSSFITDQEMNWLIIALLLVVCSLITLLLDVFILVIIFQFLYNHFPKNTKFMPIISSIALLASALNDALTFSILKHLIQNQVLSIPSLPVILERMSSFLVIACVYAVIFMAYASYVTKGELSEYLNVRPTFDLITSGQETIPIEFFLAERRRAELLFDLMTHDIRNALQVLYMNVELMETAQDLEDIDFPIDKIKDITDFISTIGSLHEYDSEIIHRKWMNLTEVIQAAVTNVRNQFKGINLHVTHTKNDLYLKFCPLLESALEELITNAIIHNPNQENIAVNIDVQSTKRDRNLFLKVWKQNQVVLSISDNGPGIPEAIRSILLDPLNNLNRRTGFGYVIIKLAVDFLNGEYTIGRTISGKGTRVEIKLPLI